MRLHRTLACALALLLAAPLAIPLAVAADATLTIRFTNDGLPLEDPLEGRFYVYDPEDDETYVAWGHAARPVSVPAGVYTVVIRYVNGTIEREQVLERIELAGDVEREVDFHVRFARLTLSLTDGGLPVPPFGASFSLHRAGQRGTPLASKRPGETVTVPPGLYDIEIVFRGATGLESKWLAGYALEGRREETVEIGSAPVRLGATPPEADRPPPPETGDRVTVRVLNRGRPLADAWCGLYRRGEREAELYSAKSGETVGIRPGSYDIGCFLRRRGVRAERWVENRALAGAVALDVDLEFEEASFRVRPARGAARDARGAVSLLLVVDSSAEMAAELDGRTRLEQLRESLVPAIDSLQGTDTSVGLRVFGIAPRGQDDCNDSTLLVPVSGSSRRALARSLGQLRPAGRSPIARSLDLAASDLPAGGPRFVVLVAGGPDSCDEDACAAAARAVDQGGVSRIHVVALDPGSEARRRLDCAGEYHEVRSRLELDALLRELLREVRRGGEGSVALFTPGGSRLVAGGSLLERLTLVAGTYDVLIRMGDETFRWPGVEIRGVMEVTAGPRPPR